MARRVAGDTRRVNLLDFRKDGAEFHVGVAHDALDALADFFPAEAYRPGQRLTSLAGITSQLDPKGSIGSLVSSHLGTNARPVRAIAFDKSEGMNWSLGWHQDRTISVSRRAEVAGYGPWTVKGGAAHVQPPFALLSHMITMRIHLDAVDENNAPLRVALGSHRLGLIRAEDVAATVADHDQISCVAAPGDVWLYATPILHASHRAKEMRRRRVLQIDFCAEDLPIPLAWKMT